MTNEQIAGTPYSFKAWSTGRYWIYTVYKHRGLPGQKVMPTKERGYRTQREAAAAARRSIKRYLQIDMNQHAYGSHGNLAE